MPRGSVVRPFFDGYGRSLEARPDTYLLIEGRPDVGLKLRGGAEEEFDIKAIHHRDRAWELWEKITFFRWNDLEAKRFAAILQRDLPLDDIAAATTPAQGARILLDAAAIESRLLTVAKRRMQARADELLPQFLGPTFSRSWLVELVEFRRRRRGFTCTLDLHRNDVAAAWRRTAAAGRWALRRLP